MTPVAGLRAMMDDSKGHCQHEKIVEPCDPADRPRRLLGALPRPMDELTTG
jgi:hypothetical protein